MNRSRYLHYKRVLLAVVIIFQFGAGRSQGPYLGAVVTTEGLGWRAGLTLLGITEAGVWYHPQNKDKTRPGFLGGVFKFPIRYRFLNNSQSVILGYFASGTLGSVYLPRLPLANETTTNKKLGNSIGAGAELMVYKSGILLAFPLELAYGKMHFNQDFASQEVSSSAEYRLRSTLILTAGLRIFLFPNPCRRYTEKIQYSL